MFSTQKEKEELLNRGFYYFYSTFEKTEAQKDYINCPKSPSKLGEQGFSPGVLTSIVLLLDIFTLNTAEGQVLKKKRNISHHSEWYELASVITSILYT